MHAAIVAYCGVPVWGSMGHRGLEKSSGHESSEVKGFKAQRLFYLFCHYPQLFTLVGFN